MFDKNYYLERKTKLQQKAQQLQLDYIQNAFNFTEEFREVLEELKKIEEWEKEEAKKEPKET